MMTLPSINNDAEISNSIDIIDTVSDTDESTSQDHACDGAETRDLESEGQNQRRNFCSRSRKEKITIQTPFGFTVRGKGQLRAAVQSFAFAALLMGYGVFHIYSSSIGSSFEDESELRFLGAVESSTDTELIEQSDEEAVDCSKGNNPWWMITLYILGILYMFLALAIVCDEFFVPALEEMSGPHRFNLSMDVAGATLMAAGGSAPELATSLIGTFKQSQIGFGTIVGSAVFNVLFVIGMCSLLAKEVLTLTWWPLFRDSTFYTVGLVVLAVFTGFVSKDEIHLWESCVLFSMYILYIILMWKNQDLYMKLTGKTLEYPDEDEEENHDTNGTNSETEPPKDETQQKSGLTRQSSKDSVHSSKSQRSSASRLSGRNGSEHSATHYPHFLWQGNFRAGILKLLKDPDSWADSVGTGMVAKIIGDADHVFEQVDKDGNEYIDGDELQQLFDLLECRATPAELREVFVELDTNGDGVISRKEFTEWYCKSEERIMSQVRHVFDQIDVDKSNSIDRDELKTLLATLDPHVSDEDVESALEEMYRHGNPEEITFEEFSEWYKRSLLYEKQKQLIEDDIEGVWENISPPKNGRFRDWVWYIICLPLVLVLTFMIPDVQRPGNAKWCYVAFFMSIVAIGGFSYLMVDWAEIVGATFGIPDVLMGLTVLAAGTSVPDLLSSVIVARRGQGDMAVSSSVGSNIFDILVGLPLPWLIYSAAYRGAPVPIDSNGVVQSLLILIGMLVLVILSIHCQGWRLTKILGGIMFLFYVGFLAQAIYFELPFERCV
jgi:K+-dependent Na+/Ca+ exchanger-like protein